MFKQIEVDGVIYYYDGKNFLDEYFIKKEPSYIVFITPLYMSLFSMTQNNN